MIKDNFSLKNKIVLAGLIYFVFVDYKYFGIFFILFFIIFGFELKLESKYEKIFQFMPIIFYSRKLITGLNSSLITNWISTGNNDFYLQAQFPDIKIDLNQYACQFSLGRYSNYYFENISVCPMGNYRYGPLHHLIKLNIDTNLGIFIWIILLSAFCCLFYIKITNEYKKYIPYLTIIFLSPVANVAYHQFNMDLFLNLSAFYFIKNIKQEKYANLNIFMILLISLIKQHPIAILIGLGFYFLHFKDYKKLYFVIINILSFLVVNIVLFENLNLLAGQPRPTGPHNSSGLLSFSQFFWVQFMNSYGGYRFVILIFILIFLFSAFIAWFTRSNKILNFEKYELDYVVFHYPFITWFLFVGIYANYDYRNLILILLSLLILKNADEFTKKIYLLLLLSSFFPSYLPNEVFYLIFSIKLLSYIYIYSYILNVFFIPIIDKLKSIKSK